MILSAARQACIAMVIFALSGVVCAAEHTKDSLDTVKENIAQKKAVLIDVREQSEWDAGHVDGAVLVPLSTLKEGVDKDSLAKQAPAGRVIYTYCRAGRRSVEAAGYLEKLGYEVRPLKQGYQELIDGGFKAAR